MMALDKVAVRKRSDESSCGRYSARISLLLGVAICGTRQFLLV